MSHYYKNWHNEEISDEPIEEILLEKELSLLNNSQNSTNETKRKSYMLLKALNDFSAKYESDSRNFLSNQKFLLTFQELIQIMRESIDTQRKIEEIKKNKDEEFARNLTQNFINNLSYNIFCYDKITTDCLESLNESSNKIFNRKRNNYRSDLSSQYFNTSSSNNNSSVNTHTTASTNKKNIIKTKNRKDSYQNKERENREKNNSKKNMLVKENSCVLKRNIDNQEFNKSVEKRKTCNKIATTESNKNHINNSLINQRGGSSVGKRKKDLKKSGGVSPTNFIDNSTLIIGTGKKKIDKKYSDIYLACENLNMNNSILSKRSKLMRKNENLNNSSCILVGRNKKKLERLGSEDLERVETERDYKYKHRKSYEKEGVKKKILNKVPKPSILANQLLMNGRKCINDFNGYQEFNF